MLQLLFPGFHRFYFWDYTDYVLIIHLLFFFNGVHEVAALSFTDFISLDYNDFGLISPIFLEGSHRFRVEVIEAL